MKTKIPVWINILQVLILAILAFQTYACYLNPKLIYPDFVFDANTSKMIYTLAGRNAVMMVISLIALVRQDARFYSFAFLIHSLRELQDMLITPLTSGVMAMFFLFLIVFVIPETSACFKLNKMANELENYGKEKKL